MTRTEFAPIMAYLSSAVGKDVTAEAAEVYFDLLSDLPRPVFQRAAQKALIEGAYPVFPQIGTLRRLAAEVMAGDRGGLTAHEAWGLTRRAIVAYGYNRERQGIASLPPLVQQVVHCLGWQDLCASTEPEICRAQFFKAFDTISARDERMRLLPAKLKESLAGIGEMPALPAPDRRSAKDIFRGNGILIDPKEKERVETDALVARAAAKAEKLRKETNGQETRH